MAVTKILVRRGGVKAAIEYVTNGDKTQGKILTAAQTCRVETAYTAMMKTKRAFNKTDGVQLFHIIQSFKPGEITPELALKIAREFAAEHLRYYETVIGVHTDKHHIHAHILFNSVNWKTGEKYHSNAQSYYKQIRAVSDKLCRKYGLSIIMEGSAEKSMSYIEWLRASKGQPTFRSMLETDLLSAMQDANDLGHFYMLMEHKGYEISHGNGNRLGFRLRGQERFRYLGRRDSRFTEDGILAAIQNNLEEIEAGLKPALSYRKPYRPYQKHPKYTGLLALYVHYLYVLGKIEKKEYPPRMTAGMKKAVMKFEQYRRQFAFLRDHNITTAAQMEAFKSQTDSTITDLKKQRTILNVRKKRRKKLFAALADTEALQPAKALYEQGLSGMEEEFARYMQATEMLKNCKIPVEQLLKEKIDIYNQLADINRAIRPTGTATATRTNRTIGIVPPGIYYPGREGCRKGITSSAVTKTTGKNNARKKRRISVAARLARYQNQFRYTQARRDFEDDEE